MDELLARHTKLPIHRDEDGMAIESVLTDQDQAAKSNKQSFTSACATKWRRGDYALAWVSRRRRHWTVVNRRVK